MRYACRANLCRLACNLLAYYVPCKFFNEHLSFGYVWWRMWISILVSLQVLWVSSCILGVVLNRNPLFFKEAILLILIFWLMSSVMWMADDIRNVNELCNLIYDKNLCYLKSLISSSNVYVGRTLEYGYGHLNSPK